MTFKASLDSTAKMITAGVIILFLVLVWISITSLIQAKGEPLALLIHGGTIAGVIAILVGSWLFAPQSYVLAENELVINRPVRKVHIPLSNIIQIRKLHDREGKWPIRTFGVGGLFGYFGKYYLPSIGHATFYATQRKNKILIITNQNKKIIITPDDSSLEEKISAKLHTSSA
ncbi:MAG: hypothetical protein KatS3mg031_1780 [Chitinophagales bacterium]|nr:MAG: hypothetical protein KatS3mg031_1780 [Chitinophagales bacterium]